MSLKDKFAQAATLTKWKADQQMRIMKSQNHLREIEGQMNSQKNELAEMALTLYQQGNLPQEELQPFCTAIAQLQGQIQEVQGEIEQIKQEQPPDAQPAPVPAPAATAIPDAFTVPSEPMIPASAPAAETVVLVCPQCGRELAGKFCPEHGVAGIPKRAAPAAAPVEPAHPLVCPVCQKPLAGKFCPEHGVAGV